ncbi:hypothetical protein FOV05_10390 [Salmonella enterica]|nr:hypothetical protein [Salmonella enterica]
MFKKPPDIGGLTHKIRKIVFSYFCCPVFAFLVSRYNRIEEGPLEGMNIFLAADKGREKRDGSALGDRLNYWDVKMSIQYDFMLR